MFTIKRAIVAVLIAAGTISAFAFAKADEKVTADDTTYYWFDAGTNSYIGEMTKSEIESTHCDPSGSNPCANAYDEVDQDGNHVGPVAYTAKKQ